MHQITETIYDRKLLFPNTSIRLELEIDRKHLPFRASFRNEDSKPDSCHSSISS